MITNSKITTSAVYALHINALNKNNEKRENSGFKTKNLREIIRA